jgi:O-antigen ligase
VTVAAATLVVVAVAETSWQDAAWNYFNYNDQGRVRLDLWVHGVEAWAHSPLVGLGPGAFSGIDRPFQGSEAHNTIIDWGASTGLLGVAAWLALAGATAFATIRARSLPLAGACIAFFVFAQFHYVMRHPILWFVQLALLALVLERHPKTQPT